MVIGKPARRVSESDALDCVLGYACANDVSARDCQAGDGQWARAKSFDTFGPLGPWIETELDPANLRIRGRLNGTDDAGGEHLAADLQRPVRHRLPLSRDDAAARHGAADRHARRSAASPAKPPVWLKPGDSYEVEIEGIGTLRNPVVADSSYAANEECGLAPEEPAG